MNDPPTFLHQLSLTTEEGNNILKYSQGNLINETIETEIHCGNNIKTVISPHDSLTFDAPSLSCIWKQEKRWLITQWNDDRDNLIKDVY